MTKSFRNLCKTKCTIIAWILKGLEASVYFVGGLWLGQLQCNLSIILKDSKKK